MRSWAHDLFEPTHVSWSYWSGTPLTRLSVSWRTCILNTGIELTFTPLSGSDHVFVEFILNSIDEWDIRNIHCSMISHTMNSASSIT